jgi:hypothetical protein
VLKSKAAIKLHKSARINMEKALAIASSKNLCIEASLQAKATTLTAAIAENEKRTSDQV